jgi:hypothetical protein
MNIQANHKDTRTTSQKPGRIWLVIAVIFFILLFVPDPIKFIPIVGIGEEVLEGGISLSALLVYVVRYWLYREVKAHFNT